MGVACGACEQRDDKHMPTAPNARSQAVVSESSQASATEAVAAASSAEKPRPKAPRARALCADQLDKPGKALSKDELEREVADGEPPLAQALPIGKGRWTWLNFWAAWCVPCREEIPRLKSWEGKLNAQGQRLDLVFVSLDDDGRQLRQFLAKQPADGLKQSYWIKEGDAREKWFGALELDADPELPTHILLDPKGFVRCVVNGAVEDSDFSTVKGIVLG
jgi:thiol-disulfide isomerase/thioredoxin